MDHHTNNQQNREGTNTHFTQVTHPNAQGPVCVTHGRLDVRLTVRLGDARSVKGTRNRTITNHDA